MTETLDWILAHTLEFIGILMIVGTAVAWTIRAAVGPPE